MNPRPNTTISTWTPCSDGCRRNIGCTSPQRMPERRNVCWISPLEYDVTVDFEKNGKPIRIVFNREITDDITIITKSHRCIHSTSNPPELLSIEFDTTNDGTYTVDCLQEFQKRKF